MLFGGIDPGKKGAIALFNDRTGNVALINMPLKALDGKKTIVDGAALAEHFRVFRYIHEGFLLIVEELNGFGGAKVHEDGHRHSAGQFNFGRDYGRILGVVEALRLPMKTVTPQRWMKVCGTTKDDYCQRALELFPQADLIPKRCRKPHDGRAAALLMAYYGHLTHGKK